MEVRERENVSESPQSVGEKDTHSDAWLIGRRASLLALRGLCAAACRPGAGPAVLLDVGALHGVLHQPVSIIYDAT